MGNTIKLDETSKLCLSLRDNKKYARISLSVGRAGMNFNFRNNTRR